MSTTAKTERLVVHGGEVASRWPGWVLWVKHLLGLDRAIAFTVLARVTQILGSTGTVLLILRFLSPIEQGYYYTLLSLVSLQVIFELGFSFVILQMAAHECAHLTLHGDGRVEGDPVAHARLASILQKTLRWYLVAAVILCVSLLPVGAYFFSRHGHASAPVAWHGPWTAAVFAAASWFLLSPFFSFLEGCGQVWQVASARMFQALLVVAMSWGAIASHHGLYACALVNLGMILVGGGFLLKRRGLLLSLLRFPAHGNAISWRREIWPFQWKIAVSWICSYFTIQVFTPVLFAYRGPAEAGRMGLSLSIASYLSIVVLSWITPKATPFGQLIKLGQFRQLDSMFFRALKKSLVLMVLLATGCFGAVIAVQYISPKMAMRMETPRIFVLLLLAAIATFVVQALAVYLRSFKQEPYLFQSTAVATLTLIGILAVTPHWGSAGVAVVYFLCSGILAVFWAALIFRKQRMVRAREHACSMLVAD
jgi:hypothetical protein